MKTIGRPLGTDQPVRYQIILRGRLAAGWSDWFYGLAIASAREMTTLTGDVADQTALRGILCRIWDLNLTVVSVTQIEPESKGEKP